MIQLILALTIFGIGLAMTYKAFRYLEMQGWVAALAITAFVVGFMWLGVCGVMLVNTHVGIDADLAEYEQVKIAVKSAKQGDPSYSGVLSTALSWNKSIAVTRTRVDSPWFGVFYSRVIARLDYIEFPGESR